MRLRRRRTETWVFVPWRGADPTRLPVRCEPHRLGYWKRVR